MNMVCSFNKTIKIPTIPSVVLDTDKINDNHASETKYCKSVLIMSEERESLRLVAYNYEPEFTEEEMLNIFTTKRR
jgi:hypothetical protein